MHGLRRAKLRSKTSLSLPLAHTAERRICELQEMARTMLLHTNKRWTEAIDAHPWPYALHCTNDRIHAILTSKPLRNFTRTDVHINQEHSKLFGCPVYTLEDELQAGKPGVDLELESTLNNHRFTVEILLWS